MADVTRARSPGVRRVAPALALLALALAPAPLACSDDGAQDRACVTNRDCPFGEQCVSGACVGTAETGCTSDLVCGAGEVCNRESGACERVAPLSCQSDADCPAAERCNPLTAVCIEGNRSCQDDAACAAVGQVCDPARRECVDCYTNEQCPAGATCESGVCTTEGGLGCRSDLDCAPPITVCQDGDCAPGCGEPGSPIFCSGPEVCSPETGRCQPRSAGCTTDPECGPPTQVCEGGQCVGGCGEPIGVRCGSGEMCNPATGRCDPIQSNLCARDADCSPPATVCDAMTSMCVPGCGTAGCPSNLTCNPLTGRCDPAQTGGNPLNAACLSNSDCQSGVCFDFGGTAGQMCAQACATGLDCPAGATCGEFSGAKSCLLTRFFQNATFSRPNGASCTGGGECKSGFCRNNLQCVDTCAEDTDCPGAGCYWEEFTPDVFIAACSGPGSGGANGSPCTTSSDCASGVCYGSGICGDLCGSTADCPASDVCLPVDYSVCLFRVITCLDLQINFVKACVQVNPGSVGTGAIGTPCSADRDCRDGYCNPSGLCSGTCSRDADCPPPMRCGIEAFDVVEGETVYTNVCIR